MYHAVVTLLPICEESRSVNRNSFYVTQQLFIPQTLLMMSRASTIHITRFSDAVYHQLVLNDHSVNMPAVEVSHYSPRAEYCGEAPSYVFVGES